MKQHLFDGCIVVLLKINSYPVVLGVFVLLLWLHTSLIGCINLYLPQLCKPCYLTFGGLYHKFDQDYLMLLYTGLGKADKKKAK